MHQVIPTASFNFKKWRLRGRREIGLVLFHQKQSIYFVYRIVTDLSVI